MGNKLLIKSMDPSLPSRMQQTCTQPKNVYFEAAMVFLGSNFVFHHKVFRRNGSRPQFAAFMLVNAFTSYQLVECMDMGSMHRYANIMENTKEMEHRALMNEKLRQRMLLAPRTNN